MGMMKPLVDELAATFNSAERSQEFNNTDIVLKYWRTMPGEMRLHVDLASKSRAPSYQELYLWLPLQATGGLADGRSYIGNLGLNAERSTEISIGIDWSGERLEISPQAYFKDVSDYIQGVASTNTTANMLAMMMTGSGALEFANVDAEIYGVDVDWRYSLTDELSLDGTASYTRGRRTDAPDNLYRLPPLNATFAVNLDRGAWGFRGELVAFAGQDKVSVYNDEEQSAGYGVLNGMVTWNGSERLRVELHASNLLNRAYQAHLAGVNRAGGMDIAVGERIYGTGRTFTLGAMIDF
jgi:iron complex outermembrane receptor protein